MTDDDEPTLPAAGPPSVGALLLVALVSAGFVMAIGIAELTIRGTYLPAIAAAVTLPIALMLYRRPITIVVVWLLFAPLVMVVEGGAARSVFWLVHRALPVAALGAVVLGPMLGTTVRRLPRMGLLETLMGGYLVASLLSIAYTSPDRLADAYLLYDRVAVPMVLFIVIRLIGPDHRTIERWFPVFVALVLSQAAFGVLSWVAPELLPDAWLNRVGSRTTGSLRHPNVYGISLLFGAAMTFHLGRAAPAGSLRRVLALPVLVVGTTMAILTLSRATWLAAIVVLAGLAAMHPRAILKLIAALLPVLLLVLTSGAVGISGQELSDRLYSTRSEESALSRLPVVVASVRMFEAKPWTGWGYQRFDDFDQEFQEGIPGLYVPTKDHASHNLFLTILSEQGVIGLGLYLGPAIVLAGRTIRSRTRLRSQPGDRRLVMTLWVVLAGHVVVTMFSNMRISFGLGVWWICLGLVAVVTDRARSPADQGDDTADFQRAGSRGAHEVTP